MKINLTLFSEGYILTIYFKEKNYEKSEIINNLGFSFSIIHWL